MTPEQTPKQWWEENVDTFVKVMNNLNEDDLRKLAAMFGCIPSYAGEVTKNDHIHNLWTMFNALRVDRERLRELSDALRVLGIGR